MKNIVDFLAELQNNNNREWFEANRARYVEVQAQFNAFVEQLIEGIIAFDDSVKGITVKDCVYRIYRDVRFSPNKEPYKTYIGAYICEGGKKSGLAGYYFHIDPKGSLLGAGLHCPQPKEINSVREEIADNGAAFVAAMNKAKGFHLESDTKLQRVPKGFAADSEYADYLKYKQFDLIKMIEVGDDMLDSVLKQFKTVKSFNDILNRAVKYAHEEL